MIQQSLGSHVLVGVWCLAVVLLANVYTGTLFSFLSVETFESIPNSLEELVTTTKLSLLLQDQSVLAHRFLVYKSHYITYQFLNYMINYIGCNKGH